jgi:hypothetical protein
VALLLLALFALNSLLVVDDWVQIFFEILVSVFLAGIVYIAWIRPKIVLLENDLRVVNPLNTILIPYREIIDLETKWALTIVHSRGRTRAWVAPASGKRRWIADKTFGIYGSSVPLTETDADGTETMSASLNSLSGQAAYIIRERMKRLH